MMSRRSLRMDEKMFTSALGGVLGLYITPIILFALLSDFASINKD